MDSGGQVQSPCQGWKKGPGWDEVQTWLESACVGCCTEPLKMGVKGMLDQVGKCRGQTRLCRSGCRRQGWAEGEMRQVMMMRQSSDEPCPEWANSAMIQET